MSNTTSFSWNRLYRPRRVSDLHLAKVKTALQQFLTTGKIPQTLLFAGPKGTGKTSAARIIGAILNDPVNEKLVDAVYLGKGSSQQSSQLQEPQDHNSLHESIFAGSSYVVHELDAASNRGIDDMRQLKERVQLPPQTGKISVFILDEVHMLTTEAFNALLKLLEEPPHHVVFVLATTELHKLPPTIVSRCQVIPFYKASDEELISALETILNSEKIAYESEALRMIAQRSDGSFRDAVKMLELSAQTGSVTVPAVSERIGIAISKFIQNLVAATLSKNPAEVCSIFSQLRERDIPSKYLHTELLSYLHHSLLQSLGVQTGTPAIPQAAAQFLLQELASAELSAAAPIPHLQLELKLLEIILRAQKKNGGNSSGSTGRPKKTTLRTAATSKANPVPAENTPEPEQTTHTLPPTAHFPTDIVPTHSTATTTNAGDGRELIERWADFISRIAQENSTLAALLQSAQPIAGDTGKVTVQVYYSFHQEQLSNPKFQQLVQPVAAEICGGNLDFLYTLAQTPPAAELVEADQPPQLEKLALEALM